MGSRKAVNAQNDSVGATQAQNDSVAGFFRNL
jgi:hypothetical protein